ncbi:hypothetical protein GCM10009796_08300 [Microbacterium koreense]
MVPIGEISDPALGEEIFGVDPVHRRRPDRAAEEVDGAERADVVDDPPDVLTIVSSVRIPIGRCAHAAQLSRRRIGRAARSCPRGRRDSTDSLRIGAGRAQGSPGAKNSWSCAAGVASPEGTRVSATIAHRLSGLVLCGTVL